MEKNSVPKISIKKPSKSLLVAIILILVNYIIIKDSYPYNMKVIETFTKLFNSDNSAIFITLIFIIPSLLSFLLNRKSETQSRLHTVVVSSILLTAFTFYLAISYAPISPDQPEKQQPFQALRPKLSPTPNPTTDPNIFSVYLNSELKNSQEYTLKGSSDPEVKGYYIFDENDNLIVNLATNTHPSFVGDFWLDQESQSIFIAEKAGDPKMFDGVGGNQIVQYRLNQSPIKKILLTLEPIIYTGAHFQTFLPKTNTLVLDYRGVDGCGGLGSTYVIRSEKISKFEHSSGCAFGPDNLYYFGLSNDNLLVFAKPAPEQSGQNEQGFMSYPFQSIFTVNPVTLEKNTIIKQPSLPEYLDYGSINQETNTLELKSNSSNSTFSLDLNTTQPTPQTDPIPE